VAIERIIVDHRIIIIGPGGISKSYVDIVSRLKNASIVGVIGRDAEKTKLYAEDNGIAFHSTKLEDIAKPSNAGAAIICTPNSLHCDFVKQAAELGLHCLCEKPLDILPDKQEDMIETCRKYKVKLAVSYLSRFQPHIFYLKDIINKGCLGKILVVDARLKEYRKPEYYSSWHGTKDIDGGGPFMQQGSHLIDMVIYLAGIHRRVLTAKRFKVFHRDIEVEDHGYAIVEYKNGSIGMIEISTACEGFYENVIEISGTKGHAKFDFSKILSLKGEGVTKNEFDKDSCDKNGCFERLICDFLEAIENDKKPLVDGDSAKLATNLICDIYNKSGSPIVLSQ
jgi:UDP-N-acetyl-2-amino-2-deoxyglucuronate dehydrogenase